MQTSKYLLKVENIYGGYGNIEVIRDLTIHLNNDESIGLFGPNGHGKTTLFKIISGLLKPSKGKIFFYNEDITGLSPQQIVNKGLIHVPQSNILFPRMTVMEALKLGAYSERAWRELDKSLDQVFSIFPWVKDKLNQKCYSLSGGQRQMVSIGVGIMGRAKLLLLDEPTLGLSPIPKIDLLNSIIQLKKMNIPLVVIDQDVNFLTESTDRLYLVEQGSIKLEINKNEMYEHKYKDILHMYFGK